MDWIRKWKHLSTLIHKWKIIAYIPCWKWICRSNWIKIAYSFWLNLIVWSGSFTSTHTHKKWINSEKNVFRKQIIASIPRCFCSLSHFGVYTVHKSNSIVRNEKQMIRIKCGEQCVSVHQQCYLWLFIVNEWTEYDGNQNGAIRCACDIHFNLFMCAVASRRIELTHNILFICWFQFHFSQTVVIATCNKFLDFML